MTDFTPGPWQVAGARHSGDLKIGRDARLHAVGPDGDAVAMVFFDMETGRGFRDARLIAAAPDLYEAARSIVLACESDRPDIRGRDDEYIYDELGSAMSGAYLAARAALNKAIGK